MKDLPINQIICGDALTEMRKFPDESVDTVICSPPYYSLRFYGEEVKNQFGDGWFGQLGLEPTYQMFIAHLIEIFNEVKRVLKKEGTCFVNLGDSYSGSGGAVGDYNPGGIRDGQPKYKGKKQKDILAKSLMLIPHRFAIAMLDSGWLLRNTLVWVKINAMPESCQDRWKKAHEYIFFFVKNKKYYFNLDAIRTPHKEVSIKRAEYEQGRNALGLNPSSMGVKYQGNKRYFGMPARIVKLNPKGGIPPDYLLVNTNCSEKDSSEHWASYPQDLITPLIKAGCPENGIVLDIFNGSGTTAVVAKKLKRNFIGIDLNPKYCEMARKRIRNQATPIL